MAQIPFFFFVFLLMAVSKTLQGLILKSVHITNPKYKQS